MKRKTIEQIINKFAIIDVVTNEWLYEDTTYGGCVREVTNAVPIGMEYVIVAVMKEGVRK